MVAQDEEPSSSSVPSPHAHPTTPKCRSCTGVLYYTSQMKGNSRNPLCVGFSRTEERLLRRRAEDAGTNAAKEVRALVGFKYACIGYSAHENVTTSNPGKELEQQAKLPLCMGLQLLAERRASQGGTARHVHGNMNEGYRNNEGGPVMPRPPSSLRPPSTIGSFSPEEFVSRFLHNAGLIGIAVGNNFLRLASYVKSGIDDMLYPDRRRPK